jgi:hypothetical protein
VDRGFFISTIKKREELGVPVTVGPPSGLSRLKSGFDSNFRHYLKTPENCRNQSENGTFRGVVFSPHKKSKALKYSPPSRSLRHDVVPGQECFVYSQGLGLWYIFGHTT